MNEFRIHVETPSFEISSSGLLTGRIWMELGGQPFPETGWNDFVLVVLGWWCETVHEVLAAANSGGELRFMDGPFSVNINADTNGRLRLTARAGSRRELMKCRCTSEEVREELLSSANTVLHYCTQHGIDNDDVRALRTGVAKLE